MKMKPKVKTQIPEKIPRATHVFFPKKRKIAKQNSGFPIKEHIFSGNMKASHFMTILIASTDERTKSLLLGDRLSLNQVFLCLGDSLIT